MILQYLVNKNKATWNIVHDSYRPTRGSQSLHSKAQNWIFIIVKGPDQNNWLLQNLFLINIHNMHNN